MTDVLKPCPFCGDPMELRDFNSRARHIGGERSDRCILRGQAFVVEGWNRRADAENAKLKTLLARNLFFDEVSADEGMEEQTAAIRDPKGGAA